MKAIKSFYLPLLSFLLLFSCASPEPKKEDQQSTYKIVKASVIKTMDDQAPEVECFVIDNNKIIDLGSFDELQKKYPNSEIIDFKDKTIIPGVIDSHAHAIEFGLQKNIADVTDVKTVEEMVIKLKEYYPNPEPGEWLIGQGWDEGEWRKTGYPERWLLDEAFPDNPVKVFSLHGFAQFYNGKALEIAGIDETTSQPEKGRIIKNDKGVPTGTMETSAKYLVDKFIPKPSIKKYKRAILKALPIMREAGVTSIHEAGLSPDKIQAYQELADEGKLPLRVYAMLDGNDSLLMSKWFETGAKVDTNTFFTVRGVKVFYDGSLGSRTALLEEPYTDDPHAHMTERISPEKVAYLAAESCKSKLQMAVHAIGDEANNRVLTIYETALKDYPDFDHRWRIEHAQVVLSDFYERAKALDIVCSMQSSHAPEDGKWAEDRLGPDRVRHSYAWRTMLNNGIHLAINSDMPGEPWEPMNTLYYATTRMRLDGNPEGGWYPDQNLTVDEALIAMTIESAHAAFQENELGSIAVGKYADFVVLDKNPYKTDLSELMDIVVIETWINGQKLIKQ